MKTGFVEDLRWRGLLQDIMPGTEELLEKEIVSGYIGFDPTADSLHIGHLTQVFTLLRFQKAGHRPIALIGGATGMVGDPSGKSAERNLLDEDALNKNVAGLKNQLEKFLDFNSEGNGAVLVNNYEWMKDYSFLTFIRDIGKHLTVSYMMAKDSVKNRLETGMSFTEFSYQLLQAFDFYKLNETKNCKLQMGGSDQWGNITSGTELIRRKSGGEAYALTTQLIRKADGTKFGKTESGAVWLDRAKTSPYKFYQFWINTSDADAESWIKIFTFFSKEETEAMIAEHKLDPGKRTLQKSLAKELTTLVHSEEDLKGAIDASSVLFNGGLTELTGLDEQTFLDVFDGVPKSNILIDELETNIGILDLLTVHTNVSVSKGDAKKLIEAGGISLNKEKVVDVNFKVSRSNLLQDKHLVLQRGKKNYYLANAISFNPDKSFLLFTGKDQSKTYLFAISYELCYLIVLNKHDKITKLRRLFRSESNDILLPTENLRIDYENGKIFFGKIIRGWRFDKRSFPSREDFAKKIQKYTKEHLENHGT